MNVVKLAGRVTALYRGPKITTITLLSQGHHRDYPHVYVMGREKRKCDEIQVGDLVVVEGSVKVRIESDENDHNYFVQTIRGTSIKKVDEISFLNQVILRGTIVAVQPRGSIAVVLIRPDNEKFVIETAAYSNMASHVLDSCKKGAHVQLECDVQTVKKEREQGVRYFENIAIQKFEFV